MIRLTDILNDSYLPEEESDASKRAKQMGLIYKGFGRWADPKSGKVTHKTDSGRLVPVGQDKPDTGAAGGGGQQPPSGQAPSSAAPDSGDGPQGRETSPEPEPGDYEKYNGNIAAAWKDKTGQRPDYETAQTPEYKKFARMFNTQPKAGQPQKDDEGFPLDRDGGVSLDKMGFELSDQGRERQTMTHPSGIEVTSVPGTTMVKGPDGKSKSFDMSKFGSDVDADKAARKFAAKLVRQEDDAEGDHYNKMAQQARGQDAMEKGLDPEAGEDPVSAPDPKTAMDAANSLLSFTTGTDDGREQGYVDALELYIKQSTGDVDPKYEKVTDDEAQQALDWLSTGIDDLEGEKLASTVQSFIDSQQGSSETDDIKQDLAKDTDGLPKINPSDDQEKFKAADAAGELPSDGPPGPDTMGSEPQIPQVDPSNTSVDDIKNAVDTFMDDHMGSDNFNKKAGQFLSQFDEKPNLQKRVSDLMNIAYMDNKRKSAKTIQPDANVEPDTMIQKALDSGMIDQNTFDVLNKKMISMSKRGIDRNKISQHLSDKIKQWGTKSGADKDPLARYGAPAGSGGMTADRGWKQRYKAWHDVDGKVKDLEKKIRDTEMGDEQYDRAQKILNQLKQKKRQAAQALDAYQDQYKEQ